MPEALCAGRGGTRRFLSGEANRGYNRGAPGGAMLSILAALQVLVLAQAAEPPRLVTPEEAVGDDAAIATSVAQGTAAPPAERLRHAGAASRRSGTRGS